MWCSLFYRTCESIVQLNFSLDKIGFLLAVIYIWVNCNFFVRLIVELYFANNLCLTRPIQTIVLYVGPLWASHCRTKFQLISSYRRWVIRDLLRKNVIFSWHVLRKGNFSTVKKEEEEEIIRLFCTALDALSEYITNFNLISHSFPRPPFILFDRHLNVLCRVTENMILAQAVMELVVRRLYEKKENSLTSKLMRKSSLLSGLFQKKNNTTFWKKGISLTL